MNRLGFPEETKNVFTRILTRLDMTDEFAMPFDTAYRSYMFPTASVPGIFVAGRNDGMLRMTRFAHGWLQFENAPFTHKGGCVTKCGYKIEENSTVINFHIPSSGISLTDEVRLDSYKQAYKFYKDCFDGEKILR